MYRRKILAVLSAIPLLFFTSGITPIRKEEFFKEEGKNFPYYFSGRGMELMDSIHASYGEEYEKIRLRVGVTETSLPELTADILPGGTPMMYSSRRDLVVIDTNKMFIFNGQIIFRPSLNHELTHAAINHLSQEIGNGKWPTFSTEDVHHYTLTDYGTLFISEGLADYIGKGIRNTKTDLYWPKSLEELAYSNPYLFGNNLITPLLDEFGLSIIPIIITNTPKHREILNPKRWQDKIRELILNQR